MEGLRLQENIVDRFFGEWQLNLLRKSMDNEDYRNEFREQEYYKNDYMRSMGIHEYADMQLDKLQDGFYGMQDVALDFWVVYKRSEARTVHLCVCFPSLCLFCCLSCFCRDHCFHSQCQQVPPRSLFAYSRLNSAPRTTTNRQTTRHWYSDSNRPCISVFDAF